MALENILYSYIILKYYVEITWERVQPCKNFRGYRKSKVIHLIGFWPRTLTHQFRLYIADIFYKIPFHSLCRIQIYTIDTGCRQIRPPRQQQEVENIRRRKNNVRAVSKVLIYIPVHQFVLCRN